MCTAATRFVAALVAQRVAHELLALEVLTLLLGAPTDDSVEVAVDFVTDVGAALGDLALQGLHGVFERLRGILHEGAIVRPPPPLSHSLSLSLSPRAPARLPPRRSRPPSPSPVHTCAGDSGSHERFFNGRGRRKGTQEGRREGGGQPEDARINAAQVLASTRAGGRPGVCARARAEGGSEQQCWRAGGGGGGGTQGSVVHAGRARGD